MTQISDEMADNLKVLLDSQFRPYSPIDSRELFAGRQAQLEEVIRTINQLGRHAILYGERGVGKTSLANQIPGALRAPVPLVTPKVNCDRTDDFSSTWHKVFRSINYNHVTRRIGFGATGQQTLLNLEGRLPGNRRATPADVMPILADLGKSTIPVVIIDEFDRLEPEGRKGFADLVKSLSDYSTRATVILVGVADSVTELIQDHESTERCLMQIQMPRMSPSELGSIVRRGIIGARMKIGESAIQRILQLSQGLPHFAHLLGSCAGRAALSRSSRQVSAVDIDCAIKSALDGAHQSIKSDYHKATDSPRKGNLFKEVLLACAMAKADERSTFQAAEVREPLQKITGRTIGIRQFSSHLNKFCGDDRGRVLVKSGTPRRYRYRFRNPMLQPYVLMQGVAAGHDTGAFPAVQEQEDGQS